MESKRQQKYAKLIQKELGEIFQRESRPLVGNAMVTVTRVMMSPDLSVARVLMSTNVVNSLISRLIDVKVDERFP